MSTPISLTQMPNLVMKHILEYLELPSILVLRKVCHDLRNFIDDTKPASHLTDIHVKVCPESISFNLYSKTYYQNNNKICIDFVKNKKRCLVMCKKRENVYKTMIQNDDFLIVFCKDFDIILRHQKTVLEEFRVDFELSNSTDKKSMLECVNKSLKSMSHPLQVKSLYMRVNDHNKILTILPYIDPKSLEKIHISERSGRDNIVLNLDEIGQLEQWKQADQLSIHGFRILDLPQNIKHFSRIVLDYRKVSIEELILLKEIFLSSSTLNTIQICYNYNYKGFIKQRLIEALGQPFLDKSRNENWVFRIPDTNQFLRIKLHGNHYIYFDRIEQSEQSVPQNAAIISN